MIALIAALLAGCADGRPDASTAKKRFEAAHPDFEVLTVSTPVDEVIARDFQIGYRKRGEKVEKLGAMGFIFSGETKRWEMWTSIMRGEK